MMLSPDVCPHWWMADDHKLQHPADMEISFHIDMWGETVLTAELLHSVLWSVTQWCCHTIQVSTGLWTLKLPPFTILAMQCLFKVFWLKALLCNARLLRYIQWYQYPEKTPLYWNFIPTVQTLALQEKCSLVSLPTQLGCQHRGLWKKTHGWNRLSFCHNVMLSGKTLIKHAYFLTNNSSIAALSP